MNKNKELLEAQKVWQTGCIANPDFIIFAVGPTNPYYHTLCNAFFEEGAYERLNDKKYYPTPRNEIVEISRQLGLKAPAFYTYHPNYLRMNRQLDHVVKDLTERMKQK